MNDNEEPPISPLVERLMPDATAEEKREADENLGRYIEVMYRIYQRRKLEAAPVASDDKSSSRDTVDRK